MLWTAESGKWLARMLNLQRWGMEEARAEVVIEKQNGHG